MDLLARIINRAPAPRPDDRYDGYLVRARELSNEMRLSQQPEPWKLAAYLKALNTMHDMVERGYFQSWSNDAQVFLVDQYYSNVALVELEDAEGYEEVAGWGQG